MPQVVSRYILSNLCSQVSYHWVTWAPPVYIKLISNEQCPVQNWLALLICWIVLLPNCISFQYTTWEFSLLFLTLANIFLGVGAPRGCTGAYPRKEGRIEVLACPAPSSQTLGSLLRTPWPAKPAKKITNTYINNIKFGIFLPQKNNFG